MFSLRENNPATKGEALLIIVRGSLAFHKGLVNAEGMILGSLRGSSKLLPDFRVISRVSCGTLSIFMYFKKSPTKF